MTDANAAIKPVHSRMPVLLQPNEYEQLLHGSFEEALTFQRRTFPRELIVTDRTNELWARKKTNADTDQTCWLFREKLLKDFHFRIGPGR